jgi:hypothetical protein
VADRWFSPGTSVFTSNKTTGEGVLKVKIGYGAATGVWKTTYSYIRSTKTMPFIYYSVIGAPFTFRLKSKIKHTYINYAPTDPNDITGILLTLIGWFGFMGRGVQHYVIKFVSDRGTPVSSTNKTDRHDIAEILLKVALNTITQTKNYSFFECHFFLFSYRSSNHEGL